MKINIEEFKQILKEKNKLIAWWLLLPAVLLSAQLSAYIVLGGSPAVLTHASDSADFAKPEVLGASIDLRGAEPAKSQLHASVPELDAAETGKISAKSFLVYDLADGTVLASRQPDLKLFIASLTKLMTGLVAYDKLNFGQQITVNRSGLTSISPTINFESGDSVSAGDIFDAMLVGSCNDAAQVLGRAIGDKTGQNIVDLMNQKASELGMQNTSYSNPVGFDSNGNYSTADDLAKLVNATQRLAAFSNLGRTKSVLFTGSNGRSYRVAATNKLIAKYDDLQAIKTGYTAGAQGAMISKIVKDGHDIIIIVLGSQDREGDTIKLKTALESIFNWQ